MGRNTISLRDRINEYKKVNSSMKVTKKDVLEKHIKSEGHPTAKINLTTKSDEASKSVKWQATVSSMAENQKNEYVFGIEYSYPQVGSPSCSGVFGKARDLPGASTLRNNYVPACGEEMKLRVKAALKDKPVDSLTPTAEQEVYFANCLFLDTADGTTCSQAIIDCIKEYGVAYNNILGLVSDSTRYMGKCFQELQNIVGDHLLHFQCSAHKLKLVGGIFLMYISSLNLPL
ncbi:hypothetical protein PR048_024059 [Dryococelus australis]|uniref:DUF659 domain-containing protein n=1 Tax=Dryococelus australis TaxID=614101 RepID=A0ABQ9GVT3_9NEOP|nr:hypothetical protein PR048_024059 [Dryococelus australis]